MIALIDAKLEDLGLSGSVWVGRSVLQELKNDIITSLQQEKPEVDLEKEIDRVFFKGDCGSQRLTHNEIAQIAYHFAEWGAIHFNPRKEK